MKKISGFSLIEIVIVIVLVSIIAAFASVLLGEGLKDYLAGKSLEDATWQARLALSRLALDLRTISSRSDITTALSNQLVFNSLNNVSITYQLSGSNLMRNSEILATNVSNLTFTYYNAYGGVVNGSASNTRYINYSLTITVNNISVTYQSAVFLRNVS